MGYRNYVGLVDEIIRNTRKEVDHFADTKEEAEDLCDYLERSIKELCKDVKAGFCE